MRTLRSLRSITASSFGILATAVALSACSGGSNGPAAAAGANAGGSGNAMDDAGAAAGSTNSIGGSSGAANGGTSNGGTGNGGTVNHPPGNTEQQLEEVSLACEADCIAIHATDCAPPNVNQPTCELQCIVQTNNLGEFCLPQYAAHVNCRASGGYACVTDYPVPESNCPSEQAALSACIVDLGCKRYCAAARDEGCGGDSLDTCVEECLAGRADFPMGCSYHYDGVRQCQGTAPNGCVDGELTGAEQCSYSVVGLAECIADETEDLCAGWCYAADTLGCPMPDCLEDCAALMVEPTCGVQFTDMVDCGMFFSDVGCMDSRLVGTSICETETTTYLTCLDPAPAP